MIHRIKEFLRCSSAVAAISPVAVLGRLARAALILCFFAAPGWGVWGLGDVLNSTSEEISDTSLDLSWSGTINTGNIIVVKAATDNVQTTDGETTLHSISDSDGNTYTRICEFTNGEAGAGAGATVSVHFAKASADLVPPEVITLTTSSAVTDKALAVREYTITSGNVPSLAGTCQTLANDGADAGSQALSGLTSQEYLFLRAIATESNGAVSMTATLNYTVMDSGGCQNTTGGGEASDMGVCGEHRIFTGTGDTSDPTLVDTTNDNASVFVALKETAPPSSDAPVQIIISETVSKLHTLASKEN